MTSERSRFGHSRAIWCTSLRFWREHNRAVIRAGRRYDCRIMRLLSAAVCVSALGLVYACGGSSGGNDGAAGAGPAGGGLGGAAGQVGTGGSSGSHAGGTQNGSAGHAQGTAGEAGTSSDGQAGALGDGGAPGGGVTDFCTGPTIDIIDLTKTKFLDYGKLRVGLEQKVDASTLAVRLVPTGKLKTLAVTQVDDTTVDVTLGYYHLPRDYQIQVAGTLNGAAFCGSATVPGDDNGARIAFLTQATGPGNFQSWPAAPGDAKTPRDAADAVCQSEAEAAGFKGTFVAFLSAHGAYDAACRALGLDGTIATRCGQITLPTDHAPWLDPFGLPLVEGATNVIAGNWNAALSYRADGTNPEDQHTWTGTRTGAIASTSTTEDCNAWSSQTGGADIFSFTSDYLPEFDRAFGDCDAHNEQDGLMCLQVGGTFFGPNALHQIAGKRSFLSKGTLTGAMSFGGKSGIAAADALCQSEADNAGFENAPHFRAYLGTLDTAPICHVLGKTGTEADKCGLPAWPTVVWRRADDYPVGSAADLVKGSLTAPVSLAADKSKQFDMRPWVAADTDNGETTCQDWASNSAAISADVGLGRSASSAWSHYSSSNCDAENPVFCFEQ